MALIDGLADDNKRQTLVADLTNLLDTQVSSIGGVSGMAIKAGYAAIKGISPKYCAGAIERLLPESFAALEPIWEEGLNTGDAVGYLSQNRSRTADLLLSITDIRIQKSSNSTIKGVYNKLRSSVKKHVEEAVPGLAQVIDKYTKN
ncbi:DUF6918 family protein [Sphaerospermopsis torques-reginae]|uniref:Uncharacterized protein n=1 Tax=Sphaerospermopsis torques-reginae ITEP-024 TaxID=984208 RepID=A0ABX8X3W0_9CYAN|nr:hypothetical protein [Sphaerospermopsis torques-reginae]QYX33325.1 hypothetical protein K2F26_08410 [Sphaerospermopsis torques-reginae ITEP-024]